MEDVDTRRQPGVRDPVVAGLDDAGLVECGSESVTLLEDDPLQDVRALVDELCRQALPGAAPVRVLCHLPRRDPPSRRIRPVTVPR